MTFQTGNRKTPDTSPGRPIFGIRTGLNNAFLPTSEELNHFLDGPKTAGRMEPHREELSWYAGMVKAVSDFEAGRKQGIPADFLEKLYYGVLIHSRFFNSALKTAVEQFKYYRHLLSAIDLKKTAAFIKSAEEEISRLKPGKKDDAVKIVRLQSLIDERRKHLEAQKAQGPALRSELSNVALYILENIISIRKLTEASIATLVDLQVGKKAEQQLIEDIKNHFKDQIRDYLQHGPVTREYIDSTKEIVARLSKQISLQMLEDIYAMTGLYEAVHDHARAAGERLEPLIKQTGAGAAPVLDRDREVFGRIEQELIFLVSPFPLELKPPHEKATDPDHGAILREKRRDMLDRLFSLLPSP